MQASLTLPPQANLISGDNPIYIGNMNRGETKTVNWTLTFTTNGSYDLDVTVSGYRQDTGEYVATYGQASVIIGIVKILSPTNKTYTTTFIPLIFTVIEPTSWKGYSLDGETNVTLTGNTTLTIPTEGTHNIIVYANDTTGNMEASEKIFFTIDILTYELRVLSTPTAVTFEANNITHTTPWSASHDEGTPVSLEMPFSFAEQEVRYGWSHWSDGNPNRTRTIIIDSDITLTAYYNQYSMYDVNCDGTVDTSDVVDCAITFGSTPESENWNPDFDFDADEWITVLDLQIITMHFGETP